MMLSFRNKRCNAFSWDGHGNFYGVRLERHGSSARVAGYWRAERSQGQSSAEVLAEGAAALGRDEDIIVIVGGNAQRCSLVDLTMPRLAPDEMAQALRFELAQHSPLPLEDMQWGYRWLGKAKGSGDSRLRVTLFTDEEWRNWLEAASGVGGGVDMVIPVQAVLDPLASDRDLCLADATEDEALVLARGEDGRRRHAFPPSKARRGEMLGAGDRPLAIDRVDAGALLELDVEEQKPFAVPLLLAQYGLSREFNQDRGSWLGLPLAMRPKRNRVQKTWAVAALVYLAAVAAVFLAQFCYAKYREFNHLQTRETRLRRELEAFQKGRSEQERGAELKDQMSEVLEARRLVVEILAAASALDERVWATKFDLKEECLSLHLRADKDSPGLTQALKESSLFLDVEESMSINPTSKSVVYSIECKLAGLGMGEETPLPPPPPM